MRLIAPRPTRTEISALSDPSPGSSTADPAPARSSAPVAQVEPNLGGWFRGKKWFWVPVLPLVVLDLWTKAWAFAAVAEQSPTIRKTNGITYQEQRIPVDFLPDPFGFALVRLRNTGTVWGLAQDSTIILMVLRCIAVLALVWFARKTEVRHRLQQLTLGGILAGALGNLYDNFFCLNRGVRDFLYFFRLDEEGVEHGFPAFNAADSYITVGAVLLLISMWFQPASNPAHNPN